MKLIVGIGNPGRQYAASRHNLGWMTVDALAARYALSPERRRFEGRWREGRLGEVPVAVLKPSTYVNESGRSVAEAVAWYGLALADLLVLCDDVNLPVGRLRIRRDGSSGGHGALRSIIERLGSEGFPRLRVGIGRSEAPSQVDHVLGRFRRSEWPAIREAIERAADAAAVWAAEGIDAAMNAFN